MDPDDGDNDPACQFDDSDPLADEDLPDGSAFQTMRKLEQKSEFGPVSPAAAPVLVYDISSSVATRVVETIQSVPHSYQCVFSEFPYFNVLQSALLPVLLHEDNSVAVCAPTGSGKTALFELAIVRVLMQHDAHNPVSS